jgi:hypothetical protein
MTERTELTKNSEIDVTKTKVSSPETCPIWFSSAAGHNADFIICAEIFHFPELGPGIAALCDRQLSTANPNARVLGVAHTKRRGIESTLTAMQKLGFVDEQKLPGSKDLPHGWTLDIVTDMRVFSFRRQLPHDKPQPQPQPQQPLDSIITTTNTTDVIIPPSAAAVSGTAATLSTK